MAYVENTKWMSRLYLVMIIYCLVFFVILLVDVWLYNCVFYFHIIINSVLFCFVFLKLWHWCNRKTRGIPRWNIHRKEIAPRGKRTLKYVYLLFYANSFILYYFMFHFLAKKGTLYVLILPYFFFKVNISSMIYCFVIF